MVFATETSELPPLEIEPGALVRLPFGVASPLWGFYAGAALTGVAYWWMTQWTRPVNLEALFGRAAASMIAGEQAMEAADEKVIESLVQPELPEAPVGGEAAPIAPSVETATEKAVAAPPSAAKEPPAAPAPEPRSVTPKAKAAPEQPRSV